MNIERDKRVALGCFLIFVVGLFGYFLFLFLTQPQIIPPNDTPGSFWLRNLGVLITALVFASSALAGIYNYYELRHLRFMENYPYLEVSWILSVDPLPLPLPKVDVPTELSNYVEDYLKTLEPSQQYNASDTEVRYLGIALRNVGHGRIVRFEIRGTADVLSRALRKGSFKIDRNISLAPDARAIFTLLPLAGLSEYRVQIDSLKYTGHFVKMTHFHGQKEFVGKFPCSVLPEQKEIIFSDDFRTPPVGENWVLDFWGKWQPTSFIHVPTTVGNDHYLVLSGDVAQFSDHYLNGGGALKDLADILEYGDTIQVTARVRSAPNTSARIQLWCHDLAADEKSRLTDEITPSTEWKELSLLYTATRTKSLRIHLRYFPGSGEIHVDKVTVEKIVPT